MCLLLVQVITTMERKSGSQSKPPKSQRKAINIGPKSTEKQRKKNFCG